MQRNLGSLRNIHVTSSSKMTHDNSLQAIQRRAYAKADSSANFRLGKIAKKIKKSKLKLATGVWEEFPEVL